MKEKIIQIQQEVKKVILGKDPIIDKVLTAILCQGHVLLEDIPGVGKTTMATAFGKALGLEVKRVQFTSDTMPSDIIGFSVYDMKTGQLQYKPGPIMTNLLLADEINRTSSKTQSALLEAMEEGQVTVDGITRQLNQPFVVLATQNPVGTAGTRMLPTAQLDRFLMKISMGYPERASQIEIMKERHHQNPLDKVEAVADVSEILGLIEETKQIYISDLIYEYISELVEKTRENSYIQLGISPRGALALCRGAKAAAYLSGRDYVNSADIEKIFLSICGHRLILAPKARLQEETADSILERIMGEVSKPDIKESVIR
ncbi:MAG: MoxR family ATPase [Lachnospiraceae bacterium]|nr:MoxR family ATPase [Lachnospiraceae bacterium]